MNKEIEQQALAITPEWVKGYLPSDSDPLLLDCIGDAFAEWRALHLQPDAPASHRIICEHCPTQFHGTDDAAVAGGWVSGWDGWECPAHKDDRSAATSPVAVSAVHAELKTILRDARALGYMVDTSITFDTLERAIAALAQGRAKDQE